MKIVVATVTKRHGATAACLFVFALLKNLIRATELVSLIDFNQQVTENCCSKEVWILTTVPPATTAMITVRGVESSASHSKCSPLLCPCACVCFNTWPPPEQWEPFICLYFSIWCGKDKKMDCTHRQIDRQSKWIYGGRQWSGLIDWEPLNPGQSRWFAHLSFNLMGNLHKLSLSVFQLW